MYDALVKRLREVAEEVDGDYDVDPYNAEQRCLAILQSANAIEELSKRIDRAIELYNRNVEKTAIYEVLMGISPEPPKEE